MILEQGEGEVSASATQGVGRLRAVGSGGLDTRLTRLAQVSSRI